MKFSLLSGFLALVFSLGAAATDPQIPTIPSECVDTGLFKTQTPQVFFSARKQLAACQGELKALKTRYFSEKDALEKLKGSTDLNATDDQFDRMETARETWMDKVAQCGNCAHRDIEVRKIQTAGRTEYWYVADGSCLMDGVNGGGLLSSYQNKRDSLLNQDGYRHYAGGFPTVLEYFFVDPVTGTKVAKNPTTDDPFFSFIAIRGPVILNNPMAFSYYFKNQVKEEDVAGVKQFSHTFQAEKAPRGFVYPSQVYQHLPSGRQRKASLIRLARVQGKWCLNSEGYLRYYTAADLGMDLSYAKHLAETILLATLESMYERGVGEAP